MIGAAIARIQTEHEKQYDGENAIKLINSSWPFKELSCANAKTVGKTTAEP